MRKFSGTLCGRKCWLCGKHIGLCGKFSARFARQKSHLFMPPKSSCPRSRESARRQRIAVVSPDGTSLTGHFAASSSLHLIRRSSSPWGQLVASVQQSGDPSSWSLWWQIYPYTIGNHRRIFDRPNERNKTTGVQAHHEKTRGTPGG